MSIDELVVSMRKILVDETLNDAAVAFERPTKRVVEPRDHMRIICAHNFACFLPRRFEAARVNRCERFGGSIDVLKRKLALALMRCAAKMMLRIVVVAASDFLDCKRNKTSLARRVGAKFAREESKPTNGRLDSMMLEIFEHVARIIKASLQPRKNDHKKNIFFLRLVTHQ